MADTIEVLHKTDKYVFFLASFGGKLIEFGSSWVPKTRTLRIELSSMFGCVCDCSHCEYSYKYEGDVTQSELSDQFIGIKGASEKFWDKAERIVISFCRMGEPTMNPEVMKFIREIWEHFRHKKERFVFEIQTVLPEDGAGFMDSLKRFAAAEGAKVRPVVTVQATEQRYRKNVTGLDMVELDSLAAMLTGWKIRPIVLLQPVEVGLITSWEVQKPFGLADIQLSWSHVHNTLPITLLGHKMAFMRDNYDQHIKYVTRGFRTHGRTICNYDKPYHGISYPEELAPGQVFSIVMKEKLVRKLAELKAVK